MRIAFDFYNQRKLPIMGMTSTNDERQLFPFRVSYMERLFRHFLRNNDKRYSSIRKNHRCSHPPLSIGKRERIKERSVLTKSLLIRTGILPQLNDTAHGSWYMRQDFVFGGKPDRKIFRQNLSG
ncbi:hypothetical protein AC781_00930 [Akkermansia glycaniphila]|nr:hypothetical protein AC781_00930 [Akkermansia glycaniphila]